MSNITHYGYTPEQIKGMAAEIERLRAERNDWKQAAETVKKFGDLEEARLRSALRELWQAYESGSGNYEERVLRQQNAVRAARKIVDQGYTDTSAYSIARRALERK